MREATASPVRCVLYLRVSLDATGEQLAISRQREDCRKIAADRGWQVVGEYVDNSIGAWSKTKIRPQYNRMVADYAAGAFDALVCWDLDRLTRQPRQLEDWIDAAEDKGLLLVTANGEADLTTDGGQLFAGIKANVARAESGRKAARQRAALKQRAALGRPPLGVRLTGYTTGGEIVGDEAAIVRQMFTRFREGESLRAVADWLAAQDIPTRRGRPWNPSSIRSVLTNPRYAGRCHYNRKAAAKESRKAGREVSPWEPGTWPALVEEFLFDEVQDMLADPRRKTQVGTHRKHLGSGLYLCGACGRAVRSHTAVPSGGSSQVRYRCPDGHVTRTAGPVDELVTDLICMRLAMGGTDTDRAFQPESKEAAELTAEIRRLHGRLRKTDLDYDADLIDGARYKAKKAKLTAELDDAEVRRAQLAGSGAVAARLTSGRPDLATIRVRWDEETLGSKRAEVGRLLTIWLDRAPRGRHFDPATVRYEWRQG